LERLVRQRLIVRVDHSEDRRRTVLRLTALGKRANRAKRGTVEFAIAEALAGVSDRDRAAARRVLARLADHLEPSASDKRESQAFRGRPKVGQRSEGRLHA
jgi:DNA-binding MarR family transcriptional regulator